MQFIWLIILGGLIFFTYSKCSKEVYETEEYEVGYDEGYNAGYDFVCRKFEQSLPNSLYESNKPRYCR
jgi:hypothetical protein